MKYSLIWNVQRHLRRQLYTEPYALEIAKQRLGLNSTESHSKLICTHHLENMQSFKQYRQFGEHVRERYERDEEKARVLAPSANSSTSNLTPLTATNSTYTVRNDTGPDLEAAESSANKPNGPSQGVGGQTSLFPSIGALNAPPESNQRSLSWSLPEGSSRRQERPPVSRRPTNRSILATNLGRVTTRSSFATNLGRVLTGIDVRHRTPEEGTGEVFVVGYEGEHDPLNPHNWPFSRRLLAT